MVQDLPSFVCVMGLMMGTKYYLGSFSSLIYGGLWVSIPPPNYYLGELKFERCSSHDVGRLMIWIIFFFPENIIL